MPNLEGGARWRATGLENQAEQCVSRVRLLHLPPRCQNRLRYRAGSFRRRRLTVWQSRFVGTKSPRIACAGSSPAASAKISAVISSDSTGGCQRSSLTAGRIIRTCSSADRRARLCEGRGRTFKSCQVHQSITDFRLSICDWRSAEDARFVVNDKSAIGNWKSKMLLPA